MVAKATSVASLMMTLITSIRTATINLDTRGQAKRRKADLKASDTNGSFVPQSGHHGFNFSVAIQVG